MWGKAIINQGSRWRVWDGNSIDILNDPQIPRERSLKIYDKPFLPSGLKVIDLKPEDGQWDEDMINCLFNVEDARLILGLPCADFI